MKKNMIKRELFVNALLADPQLRTTKAAKAAGFNVESSRSHVTRLMADPDVQAMIQAEMDRRAERMKVTADYVIETILDTIERCKQASPVLDRQGKQVFVDTPDGKVAPAYTFDSGAVLKGAEMLGRHLKMFTDKLEVSGNLRLAERIRAARERTSKR